MKKLTLLLGLVLAFSMGHAQHQRMLLFECFTNTGCGPCASQNPGLDALIENNSDRIAAIKYHVSWPAGNDPMYLHNKTDNGARVAYYGVNGVPNVQVNGNTFSGMPNQISQTMVNTWAAVESPLEMILTHSLNATQDTVTVVVMGKASSAINSETLRVFIGVIEKEIHFNSAPGYNGERDFYSVMKKLLPSANGQSIPSLETGGYFACSFSWAVANFYDINQISAIAWVQDYSTKVVYQACKSSENFAPYYSNEVAISNFDHGKAFVCSGTMTPKVTMTNFGSNAITSAAIEVLVNDQVVKTVEWTGNLATTQATEIELGEVSFDYSAENTMTVKIASVNGVNDDAPINNITSFDFSAAPEVIEEAFSLTIRTDKDPQETRWEIRSSSNGEVVLSGGPYDQPNHTYKHDFQLQTNDCYEFTIFDSGNNGLNNTSGLYGLKAGSTTLFFGKDFRDKETKEFTYKQNVSANESPETPDVDIYPNPTQGIVTIAAKGENTVHVYNVTGQLVKTCSVVGNSELNLSDLEKGLYLILVKSANGKQAKRNIVLQ